MVDINEQVVCGGPKDFMTVRRLRIRGTNFEIGRALGTLAKERYGQSALMYRSDPIFVQARRRYFQRNYPIHLERMQGVAAAFGVDPKDDSFDPSALTYNVGLPLFSAGCSALSVPPSMTDTGKGYLSRNFDFPTGSITDLLHIPLPPEQMAKQPVAFSEPYIMEWYPEDGGYPSIAIQSCELLSGTFDGINSAGLAVAILADIETMTSPSFEPWPVQAVGLTENQEMRLLLDTCATVDEAKETLLAMREFYAYLPAICIVADRSGSSFVYEHSPGRNAQYIIEGEGKPQIVTNFELHRHPANDPALKVELTPQSLNPLTDAFWRFRKISDLVSTHVGSFTADDLKVLHANASWPELLQFMSLPVAASQSPPVVGPTTGFNVRTLWHSLFDQKTGSLEFRFYLGDEMTDDGRLKARRSDYMAFKLQDSPNILTTLPR